MDKGNVTISKDAPVKIQGETRVTSITLRSGAVEEVDGVFCLRNAKN